MKKLKNKMQSLIIQRNSILYKLLSKISIFIFVSFLIIGTFIGIFLNKKSGENFVEVIIKESTIRAEKESEVFVKATNHLENLKKQILLDLKKNTPVPEFSDSVVLFEDNSYRSNNSDDNKNNAVAFISSNNQEFSDEFKRDFMVAYKNVNDIGRFMKDEYYMTWAVFPNDSNIAFCKENPEANYKIPHDFSDTKEKYWTESILKNNPKMEGRWLQPYYDKSFKVWMISYILPIVKDDRHLMTIGFDISLEKIYATILKSRSKFSYSFLVDKNGFLISHPKYADDIMKAEGKLDLSAVEEVDYKEILKENGYVYINGTEAVVSPIKSTEWKFVSVYPELTFWSKANTLLMSILITFFVGFCLFLIISYVLKTNVINPFNAIIKNMDFNKNNRDVLLLPEINVKEFDDVVKSYNDLLFSLKDSNKTISKFSAQLKSEVKIEVDKELLNNRSQVINSFSKTISEELMPLVSETKILSEKVHGSLLQFPDILSKNKEAFDKIQKNFLEIKSFNEKCMILAVDAIQETPALHNAESVMPQIEDFFKLTLSKNNIELITEYDKTATFEIKESLFIQAMISLFDNSIQSLKSISQEKKWIKISIESLDNSVELKFSDSGQIPEHIEDKLCKNEEFSTKDGHSGKGLCVMRTFAEVHFGNFDYQKGNGHSTFCLYIPKKFIEFKVVS